MPRYVGPGFCCVSQSEEYVSSVSDAAYFDGRHHRDAHALGPGEEHVVAMERHGIPAVRAQLLGHVVGELLVAVAPRGVRLRGEDLEERLGGVAAEERGEARLELVLRLRAGGGEAADRTLLDRALREREQREGGRRRLRRRSEWTRLYP